MALSKAESRPTNGTVGGHAQASGASGRRCCWEGGNANRRIYADPRGGANSETGQMCPGDRRCRDQHGRIQSRPFFTAIPRKVSGRNRVADDEAPAESRSRGDRGKRLQLERRDKVERTFAHVCETGAARRTWLRGIEKVTKRTLISAMSHNLGRMMRGLFGMRTSQGLGAATSGVFAALQAAQFHFRTFWNVLTAPGPNPSWIVLAFVLRSNLDAA